ncbi:archease [Nitrosococcus wardiae]|uniref:archease n=1 Tax=Nitrosococcus wardiae TaxID=1814290 RepID=UPI00141B3F12|nr:archease [Nitrosococcus wardiae]
MNAEINTPRWEHFPHQGDVGVRGLGASMEEAFCGAALALTATIADLDTVAPKERVEVKCSAPDKEFLLVEWLNALVFEMATRQMLFSHFAVSIEDDHLVGEAWGEPVDRTKHDPAVEVKGATLSELHVERHKEGLWIAQCIVDV